ncbi:30S ribosomal protein S7 [Candidatus Jorgensenbacteria bacterium]|nr:30S ribosomal protein S7 [Candidatus Jorgensenbacteria bacterium]
MRKQGSYKRQTRRGDPMHNRVDMGRFINYLMLEGEKSVAEKNFYKALDRIKEVTKDDPVKVFEKALSNATPLLEVVSKRIGGANYQIPREVRPERQFFLATHWIIAAARSKKGKPIAERLAEEFIAAAKNEGSAIKKKQDMHRMAEANRAFASLMRSYSTRSY